jgi:adenosylmethionine---8-amino-7-oxononanoate aminotransferase
VHLIADEIAVGFGRTGTLFACEQAGIRPDFLCLSKGITGGYLPLSVRAHPRRDLRRVLCRHHRARLLHSHSYTGNPLACRAALAVLDIFEADDVLARNRAKAPRFNAWLAPVAAHPRVSHFRTCRHDLGVRRGGCRCRIQRPFPPAGPGQGLFIRPIGNTVYFMPPYVIEEADMRWMAEVTLDLLQAL